MAELARQNIANETLIFFMSDNGPSRETRNWLDGTADPYYGGSAGRLKGHKFSLFEGGIRVPGLISWPGHIPAGQVIDQPGAAIDIFPTLLNLAGGRPADYELDGIDLLPRLTAGRPMPERDLFWEMGRQTALRRGPWKLVLNGQLVEAGPDSSAEPVFLANLAQDMAEQSNLKDHHPALTAELTAAAETWRAGIEARWQTEWQPLINGTTTHANT